MNKVNLIGRLTRDPEIRYTSDQQMAIVRFTLAVNRVFKREGQPDADFLPVVVFGKIAENVHRYVGKGRLVSVSGRLQSRTWDDQDGQRHYVYEVVADEVGFLDRAKDSNSSAGSTSTMDSDFTPVDEEDDLPF